MKDKVLVVLAHLGAYMLLSGKLFEFCLYLTDKVIAVPAEILFCIMGIAVWVLMILCFIISLRLIRSR